MKLSNKMIKAGWVIINEGNGLFTVYAYNMQEFHYNSKTKRWAENLATIELLLENSLAIETPPENLFWKSPFIISSRLTALNHTKQISQPMRYLCKKELVLGKTILHLGTGMDRFAKNALLKAGAKDVIDYDPNFYPDTSALNKSYDIIMAHYVINILPPNERKQVYQIIKKNLRSGGYAYLTAQGVWPVEHKYEIIQQLEDGYLIKTGYNTTFRKGYTSKELLEEIELELGGKATIMTQFYSNTLASWTK